MVKKRKLVFILILVVLVLLIIYSAYHIAMKALLHNSGIISDVKYSEQLEYYDRKGNRYDGFEDMMYYDTAENVYAYDFDKTAYDYLYINKTNKRFNANLCYLNSSGYVVYDDDMSITAKDKKCCIDEDGKLYYPVKYSYFNKDGTINYSFDGHSLSYDRLGKAYTYNDVPYYDSDSNKYFYYFDHDKQKGFYVNLTTGKSFENEYSFVDENGYFVYDSKRSFVEKKDAEHKGTYVDKNGKPYYLAIYVLWNEKGQLTDYTGKLI